MSAVLGGNVRLPGDRSCKSAGIFARMAESKDCGDGVVVLAVLSELCSESQICLTSGNLQGIRPIHGCKHDIG